MSYTNTSLNKETTNAIALALAAEPQFVSAKAGLIDAPLLAQKCAERALISEHSTEGSSSCITNSELTTSPNKSNTETNPTTTTQSYQQAQLEAIRAKNAQLETENASYYRQISNLKFCLTILHGQGLETKKSLKATYNELVAKKASVKMALAAERLNACHLEDIAAFWAEFICEEQPRKQEPKFRAAETCCQAQKNAKYQYQDKAEKIYYSDFGMTKVNSVDFAIPDGDLLLDLPPLKSNKSVMSTSESSEQHQELQRDIRVGMGNKKAEEKREIREGARVVINAKPPVVVGALPAEKM